MTPDENLRELQKINWTNSVASLWAFYFDGTGENAEWDVRPVKTRPELQQRLAVIVVRQITRTNKSRKFEYVTADLDEDEALVIGKERDLLAQIAVDAHPDRILKEDAAPVESVGELLDAAGYVIRIENQTKDVVHAFKKMPESTRTRRRLFDVVMHADFELDATEDEDKTFRLAKVIDAFHFRTMTFVTCKRDFETGLRYREAMRTTAQATVLQIEKAGLFANAKHLLEGNESKFMVLRRLAGIGKNPRFQDPQWLKKVEALNIKHGWKLNFNENGQILLDSDCVDLIMTLLRDRRAMTLIYEEMIDADVATLVEK